MSLRDASAVVDFVICVCSCNVVREVIRSEVVVYKGAKREVLTRGEWEKFPCVGVIGGLSVIVVSELILAVQKNRLLRPDQEEQK